MQMTHKDAAEEEEGEDAISSWKSDVDDDGMSREDREYHRHHCPISKS